MTKPDSVDYSFSRPTSPAALYTLGIRLVARYLSNPPNTKNLSALEAQGLLAAGIGILLNWESEAGRPLLGGEAGSADGLVAAAVAESCGAPHGLTIYYSCDRDVDVTNASQMVTVTAYYLAAKVATAGRYRVGVYGEADLIDYLVNAGAVDGEWQTYAWSNGRLSANADLYQYLNTQTLAGAAVDFDRIIHPELLGAWWPDGLTLAGSGLLEGLEVADLVVDDPRGGSWFITAGHRVGLDNPNVVNDLVGAGAKHVSDWDAAQIDAFPTYWQTTPDADHIVAVLTAGLSGILNTLAALAAQLTATPGTSASVDLAGVQQAAQAGAVEAIQSTAFTLALTGKAAA